MASKTYDKYLELAKLIHQPHLDQLDIGEKTELKIHEFLENCNNPWNTQHMCLVTSDLTDVFFDGGLVELTEYLIFLDWLLRSSCEQYLDEFEQLLRHLCQTCVKDQ